MSLYAQHVAVMLPLLGGGAAVQQKRSNHTAPPRSRIPGR